VRGSTVLLLILAVSLFAGAASEGYDRLWEAHFLKNLTLPAAGHLQPATWFGILGAGAALLGLLAVHIAVKRLDAADPRAITGWLYALTGLRIAGTLAFALAGSFVQAVVAFWSLGIIGTLTAPLLNTWLNRNIESGSRATVLSMLSQSNALGQTVGGPFVGAVGTRWSIRSSLVLAAVLLSPTLALYHSINGRKELVQ
jgi:MFS family permease